MFTKNIVNGIHLADSEACSFSYFLWTKAGFLTRQRIDLGCPFGELNYFNFLLNILAYFIFPSKLLILGTDKRSV